YEIQLKIEALLITEALKVAKRNKKIDSLLTKVKRKAGDIKWQELRELVPFAFLLDHCRGLDTVGKVAVASYEKLRRETFGSKRNLDAIKSTARAIVTVVIGRALNVKLP